jgi:hypothetical protein
MSTFRQLIANGEAQSGMNGLQVTANGGQGWIIEGTAFACPEIAGNNCFVTSYGWGTKSQQIDLVAAGFKPEYLDQAPEIRTSEWMCSRTDCQGLYRMVVELRNAAGQAIQRFDTGELRAPLAPNWVYPWQQVSHSFSGYGPGVRFIFFQHSGRDTFGWAGNYGSKMTGATVGVKTLMVAGAPDRATGHWSAPVAATRQS